MALDRYRRTRMVDPRSASEREADNHANARMHLLSVALPWATYCAVDDALGWHLVHGCGCDGEERLAAFLRRLPAAGGDVRLFASIDRQGIKGQATGAEAA